MTKTFQSWITTDLDSGAEKICLSFSKKGEMPWMKSIDTSALKGFEVEQNEAGYSLVLVSNSLTSTGDRLENKRDTIVNHKQLKVVQCALDSLQSTIRNKDSALRKRSLVLGVAAGLIGGVALVYSAQFAGLEGGAAFHSLSKNSAESIEKNPEDSARADVAARELDENQSEPQPEAEENFSQVSTPEEVANFVLTEIVNSPSAVKVGEGRSEVVAFSDPTCPSCAKLTEQLDEAGMSYTVIPVGLLSDFAIMQSTKVLCSVDKVAAYRETLNHIEPTLPNNNESFIKGCVDAVIGNNELFMKLQATRIPAIIRTTDAKINIGGFPTTDSLKNWINE